MEYKALAQNTYKFVTETILKTSSDISNPNRAIIPPIKMILGDSSVGYFMPYGNTIAVGEGCMFQYDSRSEDSYSDYSAAQQAVSSARPIAQVFEEASCVVDGVKYQGLRNSRYCVFWGSAVKGSNYTTTIPKRVIPACTVTVVKYDNAAGTIVTNKQKFAQTVIPEVKTIKPRTETYSAFTWSWFYLQVDKSVDDIILAMEIEYDKHDITFENSADAIEYSLDGGVTFHPTTDGLVLEQVEHIVFRNLWSNTNAFIISADGNTTLATIAPLGTAVFVPTANETVRFGWGG